MANCSVFSKRKHTRAQYDNETKTPPRNRPTLPIKRKSLLQRRPLPIFPAKQAF